MLYRTFGIKETEEIPNNKQLMVQEVIIHEKEDVVQQSQEFMFH
jgi:hypothetical protein